MVRIVGGPAEGAGFFVAPGKVLTCAHVVCPDSSSLTVRLSNNAPVACRTVAIYAGRGQPIANLSAGYPDLALLDVDFTEHPCVRLTDAWPDLEESLLGFGYPLEGGSVQLTSIGLQYTGKKGDDPTVFMNLASKVPVTGGMSGAPLASVRTGEVFGVLVATRNEKNAHGGLGVSVGELGHSVADEILALNRAAHGAATDVDGRRRHGLLTKGVSTSLFELEQFIDRYLGTRDAPAVFSGRKDVLAQLDDWLAEDTQPGALLVAPPGRGKSATLAHWAARVAVRADVLVAYVPISLSFEIARPVEVLTLLSERLVALTGHRVREPPTSLEAWRSLVVTMLDAYTEEHRRLVIIVDGIDEAAGWSDRQLLPLPWRPGGNIKIVVGARSRADRDQDGWREWLRWSADRTLRVDLAPLTEAEVRATIRRRFEHADPEVVDAAAATLYRLTAGDPLLLGLYLTDVVERGSLDVEGLSEQVPGLTGYLASWWSAQERQWAADGRDPLGESDVTERILGVCAAAAGPLPERDLGLLVGGRAESPLYLRRKIAELGRVLETRSSPNGAGHVFAHPRFAMHFAAEAETWHGTLVSHCRSACRDILSGEDPRKHRYAVRHFATHSAQNGELAADVSLLVSPGWLAAWRALEGTDEGFFEDLRTIWEAADAELLEGAQSALACLSRQLACAVASASIVETNRLPEALFVSLVKNGEWTSRQALEAGRRVPHDYQRCDVLAALAPYLANDDLRKAVVALSNVEELGRAARATARLAGHLPVDEARPLLDDIIARVDQFGDEWDRGAALVECCRGYGRIGHGLTAWRHARETDLAWAKPQCLLAAAGCTAGAPDAHLVAEIEAACDLPEEYGYWAAWALSGLATLDEDRAETHLRAAAARARRLRDERHVRKALAGTVITATRLGQLRLAGDLLETLPPYSDAARGERPTEGAVKAWLTDWERSEVVAQIELGAAISQTFDLDSLVSWVAHLQSARTHVRETGLRAAASLLKDAPPDYLAQALDTIRAWPNVFERAEGLAALASAAPSEQRKGILQEATRPLQQIADADVRGRSLVAIAMKMGDEDRRSWSRRAQRVLRTAARWTEADVLLATAPALYDVVASEELERVLDDDAGTPSNVAWQIRDWAAQTYEAQGMLEAAVRVKARGGTDEVLIDDLCAIADCLLPDEVRWTLTAATVLGRACGGTLAALVSRVYAEYGLLAAHLPPDVAEACSHLESRVYITLSELAGVLSSDREPQRGATEAALQAALESSRPEELEQAFPRLGAEARRYLAKLPHGIVGDRAQVELGLALLPHLDEPDRRPLADSLRTIIRRIDPMFVQHGSLAELGCQMPGYFSADELAAIGAEVCRIEFVRGSYLPAWVSAASRCPVADVRRLWIEAINACGNHSRRDLMSDLVALSPLVAVMSGDAGLVAMAEAIEDAGRWFAADP